MTSLPASLDRVNLPMSKFCFLVSCCCSKNDEMLLTPFGASLRGIGSLGGRTVIILGILDCLLLLALVG